MAIRRACSWAGISDSTLFNWAQDGLVTAPSADGCELRTVVELYVFSKLKRLLDFDRASAAWYAARTGGADLLAAGKFARIVCGEYAPIGHLALTPKDLVRVIPDAEPVRVVDVSGWIAVASGWYESELKHQWGVAAGKASAGRAAAPLHSAPSVQEAQRPRS